MSKCDSKSLNETILKKLVDNLKQLLYINRFNNLLKSFNKWKTITLYNSSLVSFDPIYNKHFHSNYNDIKSKSSQYVIPKHIWFRTAAKQIAVSLYSIYIYNIKLGFNQWKYNVKYTRELLFNTFYQWNLWYSKRKLNRMKAYKFMKVIRKYVMKYDYQLKYYVMMKWINYIDWYKSTIRVRLLLRLWKSYTRNIREQRKNLLLPIKEWYNVTLENKSNFESVINICKDKINRNKINNVLRYFIKGYRLSKGLKNAKILLFRAFHTWINNIKLMLLLTNSTYSSDLFTNAKFSSTKKGPSSRSKLSNNSNMYLSPSPIKMRNNSLFLSPNSVVNTSFYNQSKSKVKSKPEWVNILDKDPLFNFKSAIPKHRNDCNCLNCKRKIT